MHKLQTFMRSSGFPLFLSKVVIMPSPNYANID